MFSFKKIRIRRIKFESRIPNAVVVAFVVLILDYVFHATVTSPMEVPVYFAMKYFSSLAIALFLPETGRFWGAVLFTLWVDTYYGLFVVALGFSYLSSSPNQVISIFGITNQFILLPLWTLFHGLFFYAGALFVTTK